VTTPYVSSPALSELAEMTCRAPHLDFAQTILRATQDLIPEVRARRKTPPAPMPAKNEGRSDA